MIIEFKPSISVIREEPSERLVLNMPEHCANFWRATIEKLPIYDENKEMLVVVALDTKYAVKGYNIVSIGSINESIAHPREIFRPLIAIAAHSFLLFHNHPSGDPEASRADIAITKRVRDAADILGIKMLDHIIIGSPNFGRGYYSFNEAGLL